MEIDNKTKWDIWLLEKQRTEIQNRLNWLELDIKLLKKKLEGGLSE